MERSSNPELRHEAKVPVQLPRAIQERRATAIRHKINFQRLTRPHGHDVLENARSRPAGRAHDLQPMPLQVQWQELVARVENLEPVAPTTLQVEQGARIGCRETHSVNRPTV